MLDGADGLIGTDEGETLLLGNDRRRARQLRRWLPLDDPQEFTQLAAATRRPADDDDD